jgi:hypothetical protein
MCCGWPGSAWLGPASGCRGYTTTGCSGGARQPQSGITASFRRRSAASAPARAKETDVPEWENRQRVFIRAALRPGRRLEHLVAEIQRSPSPETTDAVVLEHVDDYDDEFFECLTELMAREEAHRRLDRVRMIEALRDYLR